MTSGPNHDEDPDTEGSDRPPYEGRRETADVDDAEESDQGRRQDRRRDRPGRGRRREAADPASTPRGAARLAGRRAAGRGVRRTPTTDPDVTGPAHHEPGTERAEDVP